jgi:beta-glucanase (GH16 family)
LKDNTSTRLVCEIKPSEISKERGKAIAEKVVQLVGKLKANKEVVYISFDYEILKKIKEIDPKTLTQYLEGDKSPEQLRIDGINGADFHYSVFVEHPEWIEMAKKNNVALNAWTVNEVAEMDWLLANNFDFITTNEPEIMLERFKKSPTANGWKLAWSDEFDYNGLPDSTKWVYDTEGNSAGWGNGEAQHYTTARKENAYVEHGILSINAIREQFEGKPYSSARLNSKAAWQFGRVEVRAKIPAGVGTWPAIWMMPGGWSFNDGNWPAIGEIDILEHVGHDVNVIHASAHSKDYQWQVGTQKTGIITVPDATENFHNYSMEWTSEIMKVFVDDSCYFEYKNEGLGESKWPYNKPFYLILNLAVGGAWGSAEGMDKTVYPQTMEVDYVRIYRKE